MLYHHLGTAAYIPLEAVLLYLPFCTPLALCRRLGAAAGYRYTIPVLMMLEAGDILLGDAWANGSVAARAWCWAGVESSVVLLPFERAPYLLGAALPYHGKNIRTRTAEATTGAKAPATSSCRGRAWLQTWEGGQACGQTDFGVQWTC